MKSGPLRRNLEALRHADDEIGLAVGPFGARRETPSAAARRRRLPSRRAAIDPRRDRRHFGVAQRRIVGVLADAAIDVPRRHLAVGDLGLDRARPWPHFGERHQRHRRRRAGTMAALAGALHDRQHVLGECRRRRRRGWRLALWAATGWRENAARLQAGLNEPAPATPVSRGTVTMTASCGGIPLDLPDRAYFSTHEAPR